MTDNLINGIKEIENLSPEEEKAFLEIASIKRVDKKGLLLKAGQLCDKYYFLQSGCLRIFSNTNGNENTIQFFFENCWYSPNPDESIQAIEPSIIFQFSKTDMEGFFSKYPKMRKIGLAFAEYGIECSHDRVKKLLNLSPEELYLDLLKNNPEIVQRIPQKYVASFLNIKPESLSRIKRRIFTR